MRTVDHRGCGYGGFIDFSQILEKETDPFLTARIGVL